MPSISSGRTPARRRPGRKEAIVNDSHATIDRIGPEPASPPAVASVPAIAADSPDRFINRELS